MVGSALPADDQMLKVPCGIRLRVRTLPGDGDPLLMLHGFTGGMEGWGTEALERLSRHRTVLLVDLPGHGGSDPLRDSGGWAADRVVEMLVGVQETLVGSAECDWLGYSMGGRIALHAACEGAPIRRLLLESTSPGLGGLQERERRIRADRGWADRLRDGPLTDFVDLWMQQPIFRTRNRMDAGTLVEQRRIRLDADPESLAACLDGLGPGTMSAAWSRLSQLELPVQIVVGALDRKYVEISTRMTFCQPRIGRTVVPSAGHTVHLEAPDAWVSWIMNT